MKHAVLARHALLTSLGLLPLACSVTVDATPRGKGTDLEGTYPREPDAGLEGEAARITSCNANTPLPSNGLLQDMVGSPWQLLAVNTGLQGCESGVIHRPEPVTCQSALPRPLPPASSANGDAAEATLSQVELLYRVASGLITGCSADTECNDKPYGYCAPVFYSEQVGSGTECVYGCTVDADCGVGFLCQCGDPIGQCIPAECLSDEDCGDELCAAWFDGGVCGSQHAFACQTADDECATDADCGDGGTCIAPDGVRVCLPYSGFECGRPFLVRGAARLADVVAGGDWARGGLGAAEACDPHERLRVSEYWVQAGLMEHASIAAFARFALQLMHLGAPRELLEASQRAMQDETEHARLCFGLAERYLGTAVGAGPLSMEGALLDLDFERILVLCFREGCVGETVAALEARVARDHAIDAEVQHVLDRIAPDEQSHAELAWKFIRWALRENPTVARVLLAQELQLLSNELSEPPPPAAADRGVPEHGVLAESERATIRRAALREVVLPCAEAVLGAASSSGTQPQPTTALSAWSA
jgi:hypothetical protein